MAVAAVLHPQDAFNQNPIMNSGLRYSSKRQKGIPTRKDAAPVNPKPRFTTASSINANKLVMGQVKILKRGEPLPLPLPAPVPEPKKFSRMVQEIVLVSQKFVEQNPAKRKNMFYKKFQYTFAGSSSESSPEPSSLPLPNFCSKLNRI